MRAHVILACVLLASCGGSSTDAEEPEASGVVTITIVGTNDLHGHVRALPILAGYVSILREARTHDGALLLLDGGDMFQGTLESNLLEGAPIVEAYSALGYDAVTIGNHEFDYGPAGERVTPQEPGDDPRGALLARAAEARYPFLAANLRTREGDPIEWDHVTASVLIERAGIWIGVVGVTTEETLGSTNSANVSDLSLASVATAITDEAAALRRRGADLVLVTAHAGGICTEHDDPHDLSSCEHDQEIFEVAGELAEGTVDAIVAGHTHEAVSHIVGGIPIVESYSYGRAFGRIDLTVDRATGRIIETVVHPPRDICESGSADAGDCVAGSYEGQPVEADAAIRAIIEPSIENAAELQAQPLGVTIAGGPMPASRPEECALGNLFVDLMRESRHADAALTNGGGLRADLPEGELTYGQLYEANPFDNFFATVRLSRAELEEIVAANLQRTGSFFSLSGVRASARCEGETLRATVTRDDGRSIADDEVLSLVTTDFLATSTGGPFEAVAEREGAITIENETMARDEMARVLRERGGTIRASELYDPEAARVRYVGERPIECP